MKYGVCLAHYGREISVGELVESIREVELAGFDSLWVTDHVIIPDGVREAQFIYREHMLEAFTMLSYLAAASHRVYLGSSIIVLAYRNPVVMAKMLASIDVLSHGRLIFGAAAGYMDGEFATLNAPFEKRGELSDEYLKIIQTIWAHDRPSFKGKYFNLENVSTSPRPVQQPRPPIWIGGRSKRAMRRAAELGDVWHPLGLTPKELTDAQAALREICDRRNLTPPGISLRANLIVEGISEPVGPYATRAASTPLKGKVPRIKELLHEYEQAGVEHIVLDMATLSHKSFLKTLETFATQIMP